ncbi:MAG: winged helix-turn-helix transcriptional regulator [Bifidobacterium dentium]
MRTSVPASTSARCLAVFGIAGRVSSVQAPTAFTTTANTSLTEVGESLRPIIDAMKTWGNHYRNEHEF